jgi:NAD+ synthase (glutamine-hydrolysing)
LDSTQALLVAVDAMDKLSRPRTDVIGVTMPGLGTSARTKSNAWELMKGLGIDAREISIKESVLQHFKDIGHKENVYDVTYENAQARERTQILFDLANQESAIVCGTGDLSEICNGFATLNADWSSHLCVSSSVPKTLIKYLIVYFTTTTRFAPVAETLKDIYETPVSPELLPLNAAGVIAQETEKTVGPYELADFMLYFMLRRQVGPTLLYLYLLKAWSTKYKTDELKHWLKMFVRRFLQNQFKRNCSPDGVKVGSLSMSQRADFRAPSDMSSVAWVKELDMLP